MEVLSEITKNKNKFNKIAVIGAGISSLSFIHSFNESDKISVDLFERSRVLSGRASTRKSNNFIFDNGANYFSSSNERSLNVLLNRLPTDELITINKWIYPFNKNNFINFDKIEAESHNQPKKYNYKSGISNLGTLLYNNIQLKSVCSYFSSNIEKIHEVDNKWEIISKEIKYGPYDCVVFGTPAANLVKILKNSLLNNYSDIINGLEQVSYKKIFSLAVAFDGLLNLDFYALINSDREHAISWISIENEKEGHVKDTNNSTLLIVQMSEEFSEAYSDTQSYTTEYVNGLIIEKLNSLLPILNKSNVVYTDLKLWKLALPKNSIENSVLEKLEEKNLFIIGDSVVGKGRLDSAMITGLDLYDKIKPEFNS